MKSKLIKALVACLIVCIIGAGGYYGYKKYFGTKGKVASQSYMTVTANKMNLSVGVQGTGAVYAAVTKNIVSNNSGVLSGLSVNLGDSVKEGQTLFTVSNDQLKQQSDKAQNDLQRQELQLQNAKNDNDVETQTLALNDAKESANYAASQVTKMTVTSPITGIVTAKNNANDDNVQGGAAILTVVDPSSMKVKVAIDELDIDKVKVGQKAAITFDAIKDKTYDGTVESVSPVGTSTNNVTTYDVVVSVNNPTNVKLGMNANVNIQVASKDNALVIPAEALVERNGKDYVMVANNTAASGAGSTSGGNQSKGTGQGSNGQANKSGQAAQSGGNSSAKSRYSGQGKLVEIQIGIENENYIEVTSGLTEGEKVLVELPQVNSTTTNSRSGLSGLGGGMGGSFGGFGGSGAGNRTQTTKSSGKSN